jgi:hypothetical protein
VGKFTTPAGTEGPCLPVGRKAWDLGKTQQSIFFVPRHTQLLPYSLSDHKLHPRVGKQVERDLHAEEELQWPWGLPSSPLPSLPWGNANAGSLLTLQPCDGLK